MAKFPSLCTRSVKLATSSQLLVAGYLFWEKLATSSKLLVTRKSKLLVASYMKIIGNYVMHTRSATTDCTRYLQISNLILYLLIIYIPFLSKFWDIKRVAEYLFCTGRNGIRIIISSIICHVRWYQIFPDITLHLVSYLYLLIINLPFNFKIVAYKTSTWVFILLTSIKKNGK